MRTRRVSRIRPIPIAVRRNFAYSRSWQLSADVDLPGASDEARQQIFEAGLAIRRQVLGADYVDNALGRSHGTDSEDMQRYVTEMVWGSVWTRPGLDRRSRRLVNLGMLVALGQLHELGLHVRGSLRNGRAEKKSSRQSSTRRPTVALRPGCRPCELPRRR